MEIGSQLLSLLLKTSEKAANIARTCRENEVLFKILVQEKSAKEMNNRFFQDFKTLADVLIQETIKHDIRLEFPELAKMVQGEENNEFSNTLGESVIVEVCNSCEETTQLLNKVMGNDFEASQVLANEVHKDITSDLPVSLNIPTDLSIPIEDVGIWIDPIDSTADYINAIECIDESTGLHKSGLRCVTILIGVYIKSTGIPILGIINQPFYTKTASTWKGMCYWGYAHNGICRSSFNCENVSNKIVLLSRTENPDLKSKLSQHGFTCVEVAGAGNKSLNVIIGQAVAYIQSKSFTYKWDTCAPQAILHSFNGGIVEYKRFLSDPNAADLNLKYSSDSTQFSNINGLIAFRDIQTLEILRSILL